MTSKTYAELLKDPRWQKKRLEVFERDGFTCQACNSKKETLNAHHLYYFHPKNSKVIMPWDYPAEALITLCEKCHLAERNNRTEAEELLLAALKQTGWLASDLLRMADKIQSLAIQPLRKNPKGKKRE